MGNETKVTDRFAKQVVLCHEAHLNRPQFDIVTDFGPSSTDQDVGFCSRQAAGLVEHQVRAEQRKSIFASVVRVRGVLVSLANLDACSLSQWFF